jgi:hypothetical protein
MEVLQITEHDTTASRNRTLKPDQLSQRAAQLVVRKYKWYFAYLLFGTQSLLCLCLGLSLSILDFLLCSCCLLLCFPESCGLFPSAGFPLPFRMVLLLLSNLLRLRIVSCFCSTLLGCSFLCCCYCFGLLLCCSFSCTVSRSHQNIHNLLPILVSIQTTSCSTHQAPGKKILLFPKHS